MDIYPRTLYVAIDETEEAIKEYLKGNQGDEIPKMEDGNAYELSVSDGTYGGSLIRFYNKSTVTSPIIAHECFHAAMSFCEYLNINFDTGDNNEHVAYMIEWLVAKCLDTLEKYNEYNSESLANNPTQEESDKQKVLIFNLIKNMIQKNAKEFIPLIEAWGNGETIQMWCEGRKQWRDVDNPLFTGDVSEYRVKPKPIIRPYKDSTEFANAMQKHGGLLIWDSDNKLYNPLYVTNDRVAVHTDSQVVSYSFEDLANYKVKWVDGTIAGVNEEK